jgi:hypothetical protein
MFARAVVIVALVVLAVAWGARASHGGGSREVHTVRTGDTLWSIAAAHYGGDPREGVWRLQRRNHLAGTVLHPGEQLLVP